MCGRFVSASPPDQIASYFDAEAPEVVLEPNYNVAPTDEVYVVLFREGHREIQPLHWGLVPMWARDPKGGARMINARAETIAVKNAFKPALEVRRCLVPAEGFYEWTVVPGQKQKQPHFISRADGEPFAFGGIWERWRDRDDPEQVYRSFTIITGPANERMAELHDRMPLILPPERWEAWLDPELTDLDMIMAMVVPAPAEVIRHHPVSTEVNSVHSDGPQLIAAIDPVDAVAPLREGQLSLLLPDGAPLTDLP